MATLDNPNRTKPHTYFEATIQLRECKKKVLDFVVHAVENHSHPDYFISSIKTHKTGWDVFLSDNQFAMKIVSMLPKKFGGKVGTSSTLFSRDHQTSKNLMRLTAVYRGLDFEKGAVLALPVKKTVALVKDLGTSVKIKDLRSGKVSGFVPNRTHYRPLDVRETRVTRLTPSIQILDPETYQAVDVRNEDPELKLEMNSEVKVAFWLGWWIVK